MITFDAVLNQIKKMRKANEQEGYYFKFGVSGGGCSGLSYQMQLVENKNEEEEMLIEDEIVLLNKIDIPIIQGTKIDYKESLMGGGFIIENPNAVASCGCGVSFKALKRQGKEEKCD